MEPILVIKGLVADSEIIRLSIEDYLTESLRTQGAAYDHIAFSWVYIEEDNTNTVYGYGWWNGD